MEITVNEQAQLFPLAFNDGWKQMAGHEIKVGEYRFCAIPRDEYINISEVTTGMKFFDIPVDLTTYLITSTREDTIKYFYQVGERIVKIITTQLDFNKTLEQMKEKSLETCGEMPAIENVEVGEG
ncbi:hypothetical protein [Ornithinibacillus xuwenensis]|uniref:Uncharacterized protein n=1 Tax=Ornithinibacillus xuwenensis TaxID=3144668 RepID=A0ABU9XG12_9BACI